jgi:YhcH/YjgK/YiaL family protein
MIVTDLKHIEQQAVMTPMLQKAIEFLRRRDIHNLPDGRVEIEGDKVFALVQRYETALSVAPKFEAHRKYIDVQYIASGEEVIGWTLLDRMTITEAYDAEKDCCFGAVEAGTWTPVYLRAGQLALLRPEDGHAPKLAAAAPIAVMKIVVKVAV